MNEVPRDPLIVIIPPKQIYQEDKQQSTSLTSQNSTINADDTIKLIYNMVKTEGVGAIVSFIATILFLESTVVTNLEITPIQVHLYICKGSLLNSGILSQV